MNEPTLTWYEWVVGLGLVAFVVGTWMTVAAARRERLRGSQSHEFSRGRAMIAVTGVISLCVLWWVLLGVLVGIPWHSNLLLSVAFVAVVTVATIGWHLLSEVIWRPTPMNRIREWVYRHWPLAWEWHYGERRRVSWEVVTLQFLFILAAVAILIW